MNYLTTTKQFNYPSYVFTFDIGSFTKVIDNNSDNKIVISFNELSDAISFIIKNNIHNIIWN